MKFLQVSTTIVFSSLTFLAYGEPAFGRPLFPGKSIGEFHMEWLSPRVLAVQYRGIEGNATDVRWYDAEGQLVQHISGSGVSATKDLISEQTAEGIVIHAIDGFWHVTLPFRTPGPRISSSSGGALVFEQYSNNTGSFFINTYFQGARKQSLGPFITHPHSSLRPNGLGISAFLAWKDGEKKLAEAVVIGRDGTLQSRFDCDANAMYPFAVGDGNLVLTTLDGSAGMPVYFKIVSKDGISKAITFSGTAQPLATCPGTDLVLFREERQDGEKTVEHLVLLHAETAKVAWDIENSSRPHPRGLFQGIFHKGRFYVLERDIVEIDSRTGLTIGYWNSEGDAPPWTQFFEVGDKLYLGVDQKMFEFTPSP